MSRTRNVMACSWDFEPFVITTEDIRVRKKKKVGVEKGGKIVLNFSLFSSNKQTQKGKRKQVCDLSVFFFWRKRIALSSL